ncbi:electron transport complex subunit RsxG [Thioalkalivibrio sp. ALJT]|uniref:electron transport complex subunit RsxG n=1 Tax=Thioalkalivibrio sp. ALJT TaxID=1158146 RepID=UPI00036E2514|nr:electron transport complex subunit RsxG [Thioalkalivibrio sp. ALJT]
MPELNPRNILIAMLLLAGFAGAGAGLVALVQEGTEARIAENRMQVNRNRIADLTGDLAYANDPVQDTVTLSHELLGGHDLPAWFARDRDHAVMGIVFSAVAPDGYSGSIHLLIGVDRDGELLGVRVSSHRETPGLGDAIEAERSDWIHGFAGRSLGDPPPDQWAVRHDGGVFDQFTGATITPRAVVGAVRRTLEYFDQHRDALLSDTPEDEPSPVEPVAAPHTDEERP